MFMLTRLRRTRVSYSFTSTGFNLYEIGLAHLVGDFLPRVDSLASISIVRRIVIPEQPPRAICTDQLQYRLLSPLRHDAPYWPHRATFNH